MEEVKKQVVISRNNLKLGAFIPSISLPALKTCPSGAPCRSGCYAIRTERYPSVKKAYAKNLTAYVLDAEDYFKQISNYINNDYLIFKYFRWHSNGDIVDYKYFEGVTSVALKNHLTKFLIFTKKYKIVNDWLKNNGGSLPKNLSVVFSAWDKEYTEKIPNPYNLPVAYVRFKKKDNSHIDKKAKKCPGHCGECKNKICWNLKRFQSVVFDEH